MEQVALILQATDSVTYAGLASYLDSAPEVELLDFDNRDGAELLVFACDRLTPDIILMLRRFAWEVSLPVVLVVSDFVESELLVAVESRVVAVLPRAAVNGERLVQSVLAVSAGGGVMSPGLVGGLLRHVERLQREVLTPDGSNSFGFSAREVDVLRLMAEGLDTNEIADKLCYSERTIKNVIHGLTQRLNLRNRSHAVAYALRMGAI